MRPTSDCGANRRVRPSAIGPSRGAQDYGRHRVTARAEPLARGEDRLSGAGVGTSSSALHDSAALSRLALTRSPARWSALESRPTTTPETDARSESIPALAFPAHGRMRRRGANRRVRPSARGRMAADGRTRQCALRPECGANRRVRPSAEGRRRRTRLCAQRLVVGRTVVFALLPKGAGGAQDCAPNVRLWGEPSCSPFCRRAPEAHKTVRPTSGRGANRRVRPSAGAQKVRSKRRDKPEVCSAQLAGGDLVPDRV